VVGNDIIDLTLAKTQSNWKREGYLEKIFTIEEQNKIFSSKDSELTIWLFWSIKEAVYKIIHRKTKKRFYNPKKIQIELISKNDTNFCCNVTYNDQIYLTKSNVANNYIHTIAANTVENLDTIISITKDKQSYSLQNLINSLFKRTTLFVYKDKHKIPNLKDTQTANVQPVSISHHGKFISLAGFNNF